VYSPSPGNDQFWMVGAEPGATATQRSAALSLALDLTWLPDGSAMLAAARDFRGVAQNLLWRIPLVGSADTDATPYLDDTAYPYADYPRFSSGGRWLAFRSAYALALLETATGETRLLDAITLGNTPPVWSPAGFEGELGC
jgi:Tol biopolymer transport system component